MTLVPINGFGPLNLQADPMDVGWNAATTAQNVSFDTQQRLQPRVGFARFLSDGTVTVNAYGLRLFNQQIVLVHSDGSGHIYNNIGNADPINPNFPASGSTTPHMVPFGTASTTYLAIMSAGASLRLLETTSAGLTTPAANKKGVALAVTPTSNRLVIGGDVQSHEASTVSFSAPGDPTTYGANDWVTLTPHDGQTVRAAHAWGNATYVFKNHKIFAFTGESENSSGGAVFNFHSVDNTVGCIGAYAISAGRSGLYFLHSDGVYRTSGGPPRRISDALGPMSLTYSDTTPTNQLRVIAGPFGDRVLFYRGAGQLYVWDEGFGWSYWLLPDTGNGGIDASYGGKSSGVLPRIWAAGGGAGSALTAWVSDEWTQGYASSVDTGASTVPIACSYTSGYSDLGEPVEKRLGNVGLEGTGTVTFGWAAKGRRANDVVPAATAVALTANQVGCYTSSVRGRSFAFQLSTSGAFNLDRITVAA